VELIDRSPCSFEAQRQVLELLSPADRGAFLDEAIDAVESTLGRVQKDVRRARAAAESPFRIAMALGTQHATLARLRMLKELKDALVGNVSNFRS
jgi:hypothetical protein